MNNGFDFKNINHTLLSRCPGLLEDWLPGGKVEADRYHCGSAEGGQGRSFYVYLKTGGWEEANGGAHGGDLVSLYAHKSGLNQGEAAKHLCEKYRIDSGRTASNRNSFNAMKQEDEYVYVDEQNFPLFKVKKYKDQRTGKKSFPQFSNDGKGGWKSGLNGTRKVLYNLPDVIKSSIVFVCEGEKDCHAVLSLYGEGTCAATCNPGGAGKWCNDYSKCLSGKTVWILEDNDDAGRSHAQKVFESIKDVTISVGLIEFPELPEKGDVSDFIASFSSLPEAAEALNGRIETTETYSPPRRTLTINELFATEFQRKNYVIGKGILPVGGCLLLAGESGVGKSMLRNELALHISLGWPFLGMEIPTARSVFIFQFENTLEAEQTRLRAMVKGLRLSEGNFPGRISFSIPTIRVDLGDIASQTEILSIIREAGAEVVIFDPLSSLHCVNENDNVQIRRVLDNLTGICRQANVTAMLVHHFGKPGKDDDGNTAHRVRGGSSIRDWADTVMTFSNKKHESKILRKIEFIKVRNGAEPKPIVVERSKETFLSAIAEGDGVCTPAKVAQVVQEAGGRVDGHRRLRDLVSHAVGCSPAAASRYVVQAVEVGEVQEVSDPGHAQRKIYYANQDERGLSGQP